MTEVYAVWTGEYSDKAVQAVFSTREKAEALAEAMVDGYVREHELDPDTTEWWFAPVRMGRDGQLMADVKPMITGRAEIEQRLELYQPTGRDQEIATVAMYYVSCTSDATAAIKAANEIRTQLIALNLWPEDMPIISFLWARSPKDFEQQATWQKVNEGIREWFSQRTAKGE